jgi:hypothetical protein
VSPGHPIVERAEMLGPLFEAVAQALVPRPASESSIHGLLVQAEESDESRPRLTPRVPRSEHVSQALARACSGRTHKNSAKPVFHWSRADLVRNRAELIRPLHIALDCIPLGITMIPSSDALHE